jgi:hypothetical protein
VFDRSRISRSDTVWSLLASAVALGVHIPPSAEPPPFGA